MGLDYVTTVDRARPPLVARAERIAARCGVDYAPRAPRRPSGGIAYVVGNGRDELRSGRLSLTVHAGLLASRRHVGREHPLVRAVAPQPVESVWDATCGLAGDALHLAAVLGARIVASDASPVVLSLLEEGLPRLARAAPTRAAERIAVKGGRAEALLASAPRSVDVVYLDPLFAAPRRGAPGFELLRGVACAEPPSEALLEAARRAARRRVVLKLPPGEMPPPGFSLRVRGRAVCYAACDVGAP